MLRNLHFAGPLLQNNTAETFAQAEVNSVVAGAIDALNVTQYRTEAQVSTAYYTAAEGDRRQRLRRQSILHPNPKRLQVIPAERQPRQRPRLGQRDATAGPRPGSEEPCRPRWRGCPAPLIWPPTPWPPISPPRRAASRRTSPASPP